MRIAYLTGEYPRATDTFIQREVAQHREAGVAVRTFSVRRPIAREQGVGGAVAEEQARTRYLLPPRPLRLLESHLRLLRASPACYLAALRLAAATCQPGVRGKLYQCFYFAEAGLLAQTLRDEQIDHLHNHFANSSCSVGMLAGALADLPYSFTLHGPAIFFEPHRWRLDAKIEQAAFVACISNFCRSQGMNFSHPRHWGKLHIIHCGVEPERYAPRTHEGRGARVLFVGRLAAVKGLPLLLEAADSLRHRFPELMLTLVGDGPDRAAMEDRCRALGLERHVTFAGYRSQAEVREELARTDVFVMASFAEGVPVVLMEALAASVPVVATRVAGVAELVEDGESGFLVPPGDPDALAERIGRLLEDPELRTRFAAHGREHVEEAFDVHEEAGRLRRLFQASLLGGTRILGVRPEPAEPQQASARRLLIISPCRDEAEFARRTLDAVVGQTLRPTRWVIVDDGSSDATPGILAEYAARHDWIQVIRREDRGRRAVGPGVMDAFYAGWEAIDPDDYDYVCKLDLDLDLPRGYFQTLIERMELNPRLGTCSGKPYFPAPSNLAKDFQGQLISEKCGDETAVGMTKLYRMSCFREIGGFVRQVNWDGIDNHRCRERGWIACSWDDPELRFLHLRPMGSSQEGIITGRQRYGFGQYFTGTGPGYLLASALYRATRRPLLIGGAAIVAGYAKAALERVERFDDPGFRRFLRAYQRRCLLQGKRRATQLLDRAGLEVWRPRRLRDADQVPAGART